MGCDATPKVILASLGIKITSINDDQPCIVGFVYPADSKISQRITEHVKKEIVNWLRALLLECVAPRARTPDDASKPISPLSGTIALFLKLADVLLLREESLARSGLFIRKTIHSLLSELVGARKQTTAKPNLLSECSFAALDVQMTLTDYSRRDLAFIAVPSALAVSDIRQYFAGFEFSKGCSVPNSRLLTFRDLVGVALVMYLPGIELENPAVAYNKSGRLNNDYIFAVELFGHENCVRMMFGLADRAEVMWNIAQASGALQVVSASLITCDVPTHVTAIKAPPTDEQLVRY